MRYPFHKLLAFKVLHLNPFNITNLLRSELCAYYFPLKIFLKVGHDDVAGAVQELHVPRSLPARPPSYRPFEHNLDDGGNSAGTPTQRVTLLGFGLPFSLLNDRI